MKTFLNVLYRRILYKIPLKLLLVLLAVFGVLFACFSNAFDFDMLGGSNTYTVGPNVVRNGNGGYGKNSLCITSNSLDSSDSSSACNSVSIKVGDNDWVSGNPYGNVFCVIGEGTSPIITLRNNTSVTCKYYMVHFNGDDLTTNICSPMSSLQCQTEYNLIPISSVDQNYCTTNNLCPSGGTPSDCPNVGVSNLYINDIFHPGAFNVIMNIPEEIDWDYAYTNSGQNFNLDVVGYNVDYEKIDSIVQFQNYKPTSEDFQKIIGLLAPYTKIIVFFVFLFIVWAWIKKPFNSKKL